MLDDNKRNGTAALLFEEQGLNSDDNNTEDPIVSDRYKIYDKNIRSFFLF